MLKLYPFVYDISTIDNLIPDYVAATATVRSSHTITLTGTIGSAAVTPINRTCTYYDTVSGSAITFYTTLVNHTDTTFLLRHNPTQGSSEGVSGPEVKTYVAPGETKTVASIYDRYGNAAYCQIDIAYPANTSTVLGESTLST